MASAGFAASGLARVTMAFGSTFGEVIVELVHFLLIYQTPWVSHELGHLACLIGAYHSNSDPRPQQSPSPQPGLQICRIVDASAEERCRVAGSPFVDVPDGFAVVEVAVDSHDLGMEVSATPDDWDVADGASEVLDLWER